MDEHAKKHAKIVEKLLLLNYEKEKIVEYFEYENMKVFEKEFCELYAKNKKCHEIENLNCYFCGCPHFRFSDSGIYKEGDFTIYSRCDKRSIDAKEAIFGKNIHQDCSSCKIPHTKEYIEAMFDISWDRAMSRCELSIS